MVSHTSPLLRWALVAAIPVLARANFDTDVVRPVRRTAKANRQLPFLKREMDVDPLSHPDLNAELLAKAVPLAEYEKQVAQRGGKHRVLNEDQKYDFDVDYDSMYSFSGFSLKYAKCQPVQYFSEDAILAGEHSPMVTEDIVILRLCPQATCSSTSSYGCYYNFADYALTLGEYIGVMLRYSARVRDNTCEWCDQCLKNERARERRRRLEDGQADAAAEEGDAAAEEGDAAAEGDAADAEAEGDAAAADDAAAAAADDAETDDFDPSEYACDGYNDYCTNYQAMCGDGDDDTYIDYESFIDYMDCTEVKYNDYAYFVRPRCDADSGTIKMAVYYDNYCIQYAGNDINVKNLGLGFKEGMFSEFYSSTCIECSDSEGNPPYFGSNSILCNLIHEMSAKCTADMLYDLFEKEDDESSECSFIESIRFGVYDKYGAFSATSYGSNGSGEVSVGQLIALSIALAFAIIFIIYACYLHHSMTNLLIKSLSHRELLPPSRHKGSRTPSKSSSRRSGGNSSSKKPKQLDDEPDWDSPGHGEMA